MSADRFKLKEKTYPQLLEWIGGWKIDTWEYAAGMDELRKRQAAEVYMNGEEQELAVSE